MKRLKLFTSGINIAQHAYVFVCLLNKYKNGWIFQLYHFLLLSPWSKRGRESDSGDHFHITSVNPQRAQIVLLFSSSTLSYLSESGPQFLKTAQKKLINNVLENVLKKEKQTNKNNKNNFPFIASRSRCCIIWSIMSVFYQELLITAGLLTTIPFRFPNLILNLDSTIYTASFYPMKFTGTGNCRVPAGKTCNYHEVSPQFLEPFSVDSADFPSRDPAIFSHHSF